MQIKQRFGDRSIVVYGGHHATFLDRRILRENHQIDIISRGEGEATLEHLIDAIGMENLSLAFLEFPTGKAKKSL